MADYVDFDLTIVRDGASYAARVTTAGPGPAASAPFELPFAPAELAQFMVAVGPPRATSRRLAPAAGRVLDVKDYGARLGDALLAGDVRAAFTEALREASAQGRALRLRLRLDGVPELDPVPWEYLYDRTLDRFLALSRQTPVVRLLDALEAPPPVTVEPPLRVLVVISSPSDMPELAVEREAQLLRATTGDLVAAGQLQLVMLEQATLGGLQLALLEDYHVLHFVGHGGFDRETQEGVLVLERDDGTAHRVSGARLGTLLHDARGMQLAVLNACEGARTSGRDAFSGVAQELVRRGLPAVVAMQTEISDRAALVFAHEFYSYLTRGLLIDEVMSEVRKAMAVSDEASEWGTAVLLRSGSSQPFAVRPAVGVAPGREQRWDALYQGAQAALAAGTPAAALTMLQQLDAERPGYRDVTQLLERVDREADAAPLGATTPAGATAPPGATTPPGSPATGSPAPGSPTLTIPATPPLDVPPPQPQPAPAPPPIPGLPPRRRAGLYAAVAGGVVVAVIAGAVAWNSLRPTPTPSPAATLIPAPEPSTPAGVESPAPGGGTDAVTLACGPAPTGAVAAGDFAAACATTAPIIDASLDEWDDANLVEATTEIAPDIGSTPGDFAALWQLRWDTEALYAAAIVLDADIRFVDPTRPDQFWVGDSISFEFGPAEGLTAGDGVRNGRDRHVMVGITPDGPLGAVNVAASGGFPAGGLEPRITAAGVPNETGYQLEARIPWSALGVDAPTRGAVFVANLNASDAARTDQWGFGRMVSSNPDRTATNQPRPGTWQTLVLTDG